MIKFLGKAGLVQRVLPNYRSEFFNALARSCQGGLGVFAGDPRPSEMIKPIDNLEDAQLTHGKNLHFFQKNFYLCYQIGLLNWLKTWDPDVLIVEANPRYLRTPAAIRWMHREGRPVIGWGLGAPPISGVLEAVRRHFRKQFIRQFDALITYSKSGAQEYAQAGFPEQKIFVAVNAVTPPPQHPLPDRPSPSEVEVRKVLFVGRLQARKRIDNLLHACADLPAQLQPELVIVGDGLIREELESLAQKIYPKTVFTGALYGEALAEQFKAADLFVLPGTGGLAIQQAMSFGLPVIAAEADGTQTDLVRPDNGWQVPSNDLTALRETLACALSDLESLRRMGAESYRIVSEEINLDQMVAVFIEAMKQVVREN